MKSALHYKVPQRTAAYRKERYFETAPRDWYSEGSLFFKNGNGVKFFEWFESDLVQHEISKRLVKSEDYDTACIVVMDEDGGEKKFYHPGAVELFKIYMHDTEKCKTIFGDEGFIYGISYDNGMVKIGRSARGYKQRLGCHDFSMKIMGAVRTDHFVTRKVKGYKDVETSLIHCMNELFEPTTHEWYKCIDLTKVKQIVRELIKDR